MDRPPLPSIEPRGCLYVGLWIVVSATVLVVSKLINVQKIFIAVAYPDLNPKF